MVIEIKDILLNDVNALVKFVFENDENANNEVKKVLSFESFNGKEGELLYTTEISDSIKYNIYVGCGKAEEFDSEVLRNVSAKAIKKVKELKISKVGFELLDTEKVCVGGRVKSITEGISLGLYSFDKYKCTKNDYNVEVFISNVPEDKKEKAKSKVKESLNVTEGIKTARDLINEPSNVIYPETLAQFVTNLSDKYGFEVEVFDEDKCKDLNMEAFLSVAKGSTNKPKFIVIRYNGDKDSTETLGLVGKGLTYDSGGYSLKPTPSMVSMNGDMGGAASVIGTMMAISSNKVKKNVVAVIAACENLISGHAYKPGDIINSMGGKTIEVLNTDAEGRITLIDAITYIIREEKVDKVIDVATLTGAAIVALGLNTTALMTNNEEFYNDFMKASDATKEIFWRLPTFKHYEKQIKGSLADLKNVDTVGGAGTIVAGMFLKEFTEGKPWIHLDIASTSDTKSPEKEYISKGGTGVAVRTLYHLIKGPCGCKK